MLTFVHHDGALGDVVLSLPCFWRLREEGATLHVACRADIGRLLRDSGAVEEVTDVGSARYAELYADRAGAIGAFLGTFDRAVVFTVDAESAVASAIAMSVRDTRVIRTVPPSGVRVPAAQYRLGQLDAQAASNAVPRLGVPATQRDLASAMLARWGWKGDRPLVMVHPGSGGQAKCWPLENYLSVSASLADAGAFVVIFTGPAENDAFLDRVETFCRGREHAVHVGDAELTALAALLGHCTVYIGNDSGVSHLAAAVGSPVIVLFGPTDPIVWAPAGESVTALSAEAIEAIAEADVLDAVQTLFTRLAAPGEWQRGAGREVRWRDR